MSKRAPQSFLSKLLPDYQRLKMSGFAKWIELCRKTVPKMDRKTGYFESSDMVKGDCTIIVKINAFDNC
jgi:hypothetical protein